MVKSDEPETMGMEHLRKLFIGGLDGRTTEETLKSYFEQWGTIVDVVVMKDPKTKRSRGFGFITYSEASMVDAAQAARPHKIDAKVVEPKRAVPRSQITSPETSATVKKIFVGGIKDEVTEADMEEYFGKFGNIISVSLATEKDTGKKRGFGFIEFDDYDAVDRICRGSHSLKNKPVDVKKAFSKAELAKIHGGRNGPNESNQNTNNGPDWNAQGGSGAMHNNWNGPPMNMAPGGYGPRPNWGNNNWSNPPGCMPGNMGQGMNAGPGCMYPTGMTPNNMGNMGPNNMGNMGNMGPGNMCGMPMGNMGPPNMGGMQNYGNMPPGMGMNMGMGMPDAMQGGMCAPGMPNANMTGGAMNPAMANNMANGNRMGNNMPMMNAAPPNWNYGQCGNNSGWGNSNEHLAAPYQQNDTGGPVRAGPMSGTPARNAPYNQNANSGSSGYGNNHGNAQAGGRRF